MAKVAVFFADGFEEIEGLSPVDYLRRADIDVTTVGVKGKIIEVNENKRMVVTSSHKIPVITDMTLEEYLAQYESEIPDCVVCPGGSKGAENLAESEELLKHLEKADNQGKLVAAICASPAVVLGKTSVPNGKKWTCYPGMETESNPAYLNNYSNKVFITDGNLVTGRGPGASEEFSMELVRILAGIDVYKKIHAGSQQR